MEYGKEEGHGHEHGDDETGGGSSSGDPTMTRPNGPGNQERDLGKCNREQGKRRTFSAQSSVVRTAEDNPTEKASCTLSFPAGKRQPSGAAACGSESGSDEVQSDCFYLAACEKKHQYVKCRE